MSEKIILKIDISKIDKKKVLAREYTSNKTGETVKLREYMLDIVPLKKRQVIKVHDNGDGYVKTHFAAESQTKEEREAKTPTVYVGEGFMNIPFEDME